MFRWRADSLLHHNHYHHNHLDHHHHHLDQHHHHHLDQHHHHHHLDLEEAGKCNLCKAYMQAQLCLGRAESSRKGGPVQLRETGLSSDYLVPIAGDQQRDTAGHMQRDTAGHLQRETAGHQQRDTADHQQRDTAGHHVNKREFRGQEKDTVRIFQGRVTIV